jgi:ATP-dependent helicase/DNAse subunit B
VREQYDFDSTTNIADLPLSKIIEKAFFKKSYYCFRSAELALAIKMLIQQLTVNLTAQQLLEQGRGFKPRYFEECIANYEIAGTQVSLSFTAYLDRVDVMDDLMMILDYKTGDATFDINSFLAKQRLQLATYLLLAENRFALKAVGAFYSPLVNKVISHNYFKLSLASGLSEINENDLLYKVHRLNGLTLTTDAMVLQAMDPSGKGIKNRTKALDTELLQKALLKIYQEIVNSITQGEFSIRPFRQACDYCGFKAICQFKGEYQTIQKYQANGKPDSNDILRSFVEGGLN